MDSALNRPVEDWGKLLGDVAAVSAMLDRLLHHGNVHKVRSSKLAHQSGDAIIRSNARVLLRGRSLALPGNSAFPPEPGRKPAVCRPSFRPVIGAPVASLRCRTLSGVLR